MAASARNAVPGSGTGLMVIRARSLPAASAEPLEGRSVTPTPDEVAVRLLPYE